jgi:hypothetical protein
MAAGMGLISALIVLLLKDEEYLVVDVIDTGHVLPDPKVWDCIC